LQATAEVIRTMLFDAPRGMVAGAIQRKITSTSTVSVTLQNLLDERCDTEGCWTRSYVPTYDSDHNKTGRFKLRYCNN
jgi:hypothetical protein